MVKLGEEQPRSLASCLPAARCAMASATTHNCPDANLSPSCATDAGPRLNHHTGATTCFKSLSPCPCPLFFRGLRLRRHPLLTATVPPPPLPHTHIPRPPRVLAPPHQHPHRGQTSRSPSLPRASVASSDQLPSTHEVRSQCLRTPSKAARSCSTVFDLQLVPRARQTLAL